MTLAAVLLAILPADDPAALCRRAVEVWRDRDAECAAVRASTPGPLRRVMRAPECVAAVAAGRVVRDVCQPSE